MCRTVHSKVKPCNWKYDEFQICTRWFGSLKNKIFKIRSWAESWVPPHLFPRVADLLCINACRHSGTHLCWMLAASSTICTVLWYDIYVQIVGWQFNRTARNVSDYFVSVRNFVTCESLVVSWVNKWSAVPRTTSHMAECRCYSGIGLLFVHQVINQFHTTAQIQSKTRKWQRNQMEKKEKLKKEKKEKWHFNFFDFFNGSPCVAIIFILFLFFVIRGWFVKCCSRESNFVLTVTPEFLFGDE